METTKRGVGGKPSATPHLLPTLAPVLLMMGFWMLLGAAAGMRIAQSIWQLLGWGAWGVSVAVPIGGVAGAAGGAILGRITNPRLLVLLMAVFAGSAAGGVAGKIAWGEIGELGGQVVGGSVGGLAWATWLFFSGGRNYNIRTRLTSMDDGSAAENVSSGFQISQIAPVVNHSPDIPSQIASTPKSGY